MRFHAKNPTIIKTDAFKDAVAIEKAMIKNRDLCVGLIEEFSVDVDPR